MKIAFIGNSSLTMHNFRINLLKDMIKTGHKVIVIAPKDSDTTAFKSQKIRFIPIEVDCKGMNPFHDIKLIFQLRKIYLHEKFDFIFHYTIKPVIYGSIAASLVNIPHISVITGLGYTFLNEGFINKLTVKLYRFSQIKTKELWFLNNDDRNLFVDKNIIKIEKSKVINGEGVNLKIFHPQHKSHLKFSFLFIGRVLWDKGIGEYVAAAKILRNKYPDVEFQILGALGAANPAAISPECMDDWEDEGIITYLGETSKVVPYILNASCIILPSYREGISRVLLEAAAMEKPIVTTNVTGCRDIVKHNYSGYLCESKDVNSLAHYMEKMMLLSDDERLEMGRNGRKIVNEKFDEKIIIKEYHDKLFEIFKK
jgi:glycosyltransferase involved in cell wall biosynthesis